MHNSGFISSQNGSIQVKKDRKKNLSFRSFLPDPEQKIPKKKKKNYSSLISTKTSRDCSRKRKKKLSFRAFLPDTEKKIPKKRAKNALKERKKKKSFRWVPTRPRIENFKKIAKKFKKLENNIVASFQAKIECKKLRDRETKKKIVPMCSYLNRNRKFPKNSRKIQKIRKQHHRFFSNQNRMGKAEKERN